MFFARIEPSFGRTLRVPVLGTTSHQGATWEVYMAIRGISERIAMESSGHRTRSVSDRYDIVSEADIHDARTRMNQMHRVTPGLPPEDTREWNKDSLSTLSLALSEHNGEHSEGEMKNEEGLTS
jgi:hypothetical protein